MAIYKLGEICSFQRGQQDKNFSLLKTIEKPYPIISAGKNIKGYYQDWNRQKGIPSISSSGANAGFITIPNENYFAADCFSVYSKDEQKIKQKYLNLILLKTQNLIFNFQRGSGQPHVYPKDISEIRSYIPLLKEQQKIIDIIEPLEILSTKIEATKKMIISLLKMIANNKVEKTNELLINHLTFEKGKNGPKEFESSGTPFLDVRTLNTRIPSKFVKDQPNTFKGDILLSLDATVGLVDWFIEGFNGYLYNLKSDHLTKVEILLNVLNDNNKKIIEMNATGSTIKHASKAKKEMLYFKLHHEWKNITNTLFKLLLLVEEIGAKKTKLYQLCVNLLIR